MQRQILEILAGPMMHHHMVAVASCGPLEFSEFASACNSVWGPSCIFLTDPKQSGANLARPIWHQSRIPVNLAFGKELPPIWE